jgi:hypothetical protein
MEESERPAIITPKDLQLSPPPPRTSEPPTVHVLPKITEEDFTSATTQSSTSSSTGSTTSDLESIITVLAAYTPVPDIDPATLTPRDLLYAAIDEATAAINEHIDTLETTLALLQAITGFSETVQVLKLEMKDKKRACETKLTELKVFEEAIEGMKLPGVEERLDANEVNIVEG